MNAPIENFLFVCRCLNSASSSAAHRKLREELDSGAIDWHAVVEITSRHWVTPALWVALRDKGLDHRLPRNLRDFLCEIHALNVSRNQRLKEEACKVTEAFNSIGIVPAILKGGVHLFDHAFGDPGARMMRDLDFLVPKNRFDDCVAVLESIGYRAPRKFGATLKIWNKKEGYSSPPMSCPGGAVPIEVHREVGQQDSVLEAEAALDAAIGLDADDLELLTLSPTHRVIHNFYHAQIHDRYHELGFISLKQLHDLVAICRRHGDNINWQAVRDTAAAHGLGGALGSYVYLANRLLGLSRPPQFSSTGRAKAHYWRCVAQIRWRTLMSVVMFWGVATFRLSWSSINYRYSCRGRRHLINFYRIVYLLQLVKFSNWNYLLNLIKSPGDTWKKIKKRRDFHFDFNPDFPDRSQFR